MSEEPRAPSLRDAMEAWAFIAANSFGGPAGQIAVMHKVLVEERRWLSEERFLHALNTCMLLPGPEAQQLATYTGWLTHGYRGGLIAGWMFVLPGFVAILGLSAMYTRWHELPAVASALLGLEAAVIAVVLEAVLRIGRRVLKSPAQGLLALASFVALLAFHLPFPLVVLGAGALGLLVPAAFPAPVPPVPRPGESEPLVDALLRAGKLPWTRPAPARDLLVTAGIALLWLLPTVALAGALGPASTWTSVAAFFSQAALVTFGGGYAVLSWVSQHAVESHHWLTATEMLDGLGLAETTPGPLIQVVQFVGFLATSRDPSGMDPAAAGALGSVLTTWVTFWPSFLFVLGAAPYVERLREVARLSSALRAITCAVVGVIGHLGVSLGLHVLFGTVDALPLGPAVVPVPAWSTLHPLAVVIALGAGVALVRFKLPMVVVVLAALIAGLLAFGVSFLLRWGMS